MLQRHSDFIFGQAMIYFGAFHTGFNAENEIDETIEFFDFLNVETKTKHTRQQEIGLYFQWSDC